MSKKKALITGITGMVGSHLADFLLANTDWDIYGMCRWRSPLDNVHHLLDRANKKDRVFFYRWGSLRPYISSECCKRSQTGLCIPPGRPELSENEFQLAYSYPGYKYSWDLTIP